MYDYITWEAVLSESEEVEKDEIRYPKIDLRKTGTAASVEEVNVPKIFVLITMQTFKRMRIAVAFKLLCLYVFLSHNSPFSYKARLTQR